jgi:hypothetical protein
VGLSYWDYQSRVQGRPTSRDTVGAFVFGSADSLSESQNGGPMHEIVGYQFHRIDLRWDRQLSPTGHLRVAFTFGYDRSAGSNNLDSITNTWSTSSVEAGIFGARAQWTDRLTDDLEAGAGVDVVAEPYHISVPTQSPVAGDFTGKVLGVQTADFDQMDVNAGAYGELAWRPSKRLELRPGVRVDLFSSSGAPSAIPGFGGTTAAAGTVDPRLSARWQLTDSVAWLTALGIAHQASNIPLPSPGLEFSQLTRGVQASYQMSEGAEVQLPAGITATLDGFVHNYTGLADFYEACPGGGGTSCNFNGRSFGLELYVKRPLTKRFGWWLAYTLSRTERDAFYSGHWTRVLSQFDRTHVVQAVAAANLGKGWQAGLHVVAYSGFPYSTTGRTDLAPDSRGPPFVRVDARIAKAWKALGGTFTFVIEGLNVLLSKESIGTSCSTTFGGMGTPMTQCQPNAIGPITIPSIGVDAAW